MQIKKLPGCYDITIVSKDDIIETIKKNITDGEVLDEIISKLEFDASNFLAQGKWIGVPYLGNIRIPPVKLATKEHSAIFKDAKKEMSNKDYLLFMRTDLSMTDEHLRKERLYRYKTTLAINKYRSLYNKIAAKKGVLYARIYIHSLYCAAPLKQYYEYILEDD